MDTETLCLKLVENLIDRYIREHDAAMIYWNHSLNDWDYHHSSDTTLYKQEINNLIMQINNGNVVNVTKGLVVDVKGTQMYPVEIEFKNVQCPAYAILEKSWRNEFMNRTPYFFRSEKKRDQFFDDLIKQGTPLKTSSTQDVKKSNDSNI